MGADIADELEGSEHAKRRLAIILKNLRGEVTAIAAAAEMGVSESGYHKIRRQMLQASMERLEPKVRGPKTDDDDPELQAKDAQIRALEDALERAEIKLELLESERDWEAIEEERLAAYEAEQKKLKARQLKERRKKEKKKRKR